MKKTLIALMALAGVACGATTTDINAKDSFQTTIAESGYTEGDKYTITINVTGFDYSTGCMLTLADNYYMVAQTPGNNTCFVGLSYKDTGGALYSSADTQVSPNFVKDILTPNTTDNTATWTTASGQYLYSWITTDVKANASDMKQEPKYIKDATITIVYDGVSTELELELANGITSAVNLTDIQLKATDIKLGALITSATGSFTYTPAIPEPATATLSLLALCGLCARRRRA